MTRLCTLIPAYKPDFLAPLFESLQRQTWRDFRVVLSDDSPGARITEALRRGRFDAQIAGLHLSVVRGPGSALRNHERVLAAWGGRTPLVHLLMDDDVVDPAFYECHVGLHDAEPALAASVSLRRLIDAQGRPLGMLPLPAFIDGADAPVVHIDGDRLVKSTVAPCENWLGELSNMVLSACAARRFPLPPAEGVSWFGLPDIGLLLNTQDLGPIAVLRETLGGFRQHAGQTTADSHSRSLKIAHLAWLSFALRARELGQLDDDAVRGSIAIAIRRCLQLYADDADLRPFFELVRDDLTDLDALTAGFGRLWGQLLDANADTRRGDHHPFLCTPTPTTKGRASAAADSGGLLILDDFFPNLLTGFRVAEYNALMQSSPAVRVASCVDDFEAQHTAYAARYAALAARVQRFDPAAAPRAGDVVYLNFLNNALRYLPWIERHRVPFALTLYPGGGFGIGAPDSDSGLRRVLASPQLRHVITTQPITEAYLHDLAARHGLVLPPCTAIDGGVANAMYFDAAASAHGPRFGTGKATLDIVFVAEKYMPRGANKGYPEFVAAAHALGDLPFARFHVVGSFGADDIDVRALGPRIRFHGRLETPALQRLLTGMDVAISLSRPGVLHAGNFDGFPTGSGVEASLCGAALIANDPLAQNTCYEDRASMMLVALDAQAVEAAVRWLAQDARRIAMVAEQGQAVTRKRYAPEVQIAPRLAMLQALMADAARRSERAA